MNIDIKVNSDEFFSMGIIDHVVTPSIDGLTPTYQELKDMGCISEEEFGVTPNQPISNAAPLDNSREGHPFDPFGGTSWGGKKQGFN
jgi:hypothetical protein